jgi:aspartate kinase
VEYAKRFDLPIHVRSSFSQRPGTIVAATWEDAIETSEKESSVEQPIISGVAHDRSEAKITLVGVPDVVGAAARIFGTVAQAGVNVDMIVQNVSAAGTGRTDISFTLPQADGPAALAALQAMGAELGVTDIRYNDQIGKVSLVGAGMRTHPGVSAKFFSALADAGVNIEMISTSEIRISVVVQADEVDRAVSAVHTAFELDSAEIEAVVYGGTGR